MYAQGSHHLCILRLRDTHLALIKRKSLLLRAWRHLSQQNREREKERERERERTGVPACVYLC